MIDYQRIVEFLRDFRAAPGQAVTDEVRRYATEYAQRCSEANERLRQCSVFLQQGLRSEAIHLADESPNLLELAAALDLPDAAGWVEFCQQNDLPVPPPLQIERANRLNDAYGQEQPVEHLLKRHRRLALCRAPIKDRLETIRQLATADTTGSFWEKDIRVFERARLKELKSAFSAALEKRDGPAMGELSGEVLNTQWLEEPSPDLLSAAQGADNHVRLVSADVKLREVLGKLREAFAARDHGQCSALVQQIPKILAEGNRPGVSAETAAELKPIIMWIKQEDSVAARRKEVAATQRLMREALDTDAPDTQLESLYQRLKAFDEAIPQDIEERHQKTTHGRQRTARRKYVLILAGTAAVLVLAILGSWRYSRSQVAAGWVRRIAQANTNRDLPLVKQLIDEQERRAPQFNSMPDLVTAKKEAAQLQAENDDDRKAMQEELTALNSELKADAQLESSPDTHIENLMSAAQHADLAAKLLPDAQRFAWVDSNGDFPYALSDLKSVAADLRKSADQKAIAQAGALSDRIDRLASASPETDQAIDAISAEIESLRQIEGLGKGASDAIASLSDKLSSRRTALAKDRDLTQQLLALRQRQLSVDGWKKNLQTFVAAYPDAPASHEFTSALNAVEGSAAIEDLETMVGGWSGKYEVTSENSARARLDQVSSYTKAHPKSPYRGAVDAYANYLEQAAAAMAVKSSWQQGFADVLANPMISDLKYVTASDGTKYNVLGDIHIVTQEADSRVRISFDVIDPANLAKRKTITLGGSLTLVSDKPQLVPHAIFAQYLDGQLKQVSSDNWETLGIDLIDRIARDTEMDPVVRAILLQQALVSTVKIAGWGLGGIYDQAIGDLGRQEVDNIAWYDPDKPVSPVTLAALKQIVSNLPKADVARKAIQDNRAKMFQNITPRYSVMGTLMPDDAGNMAIYPSAADAGSVAWAAGPMSDADQPAALVRVGHVENGKFQIDATAARGLPEGTLVFIGK
jgi:hypothetical protein